MTYPKSKSLLVTESRLQFRVHGYLECSRCCQCSSDILQSPPFQVLQKATKKLLLTWAPLYLKAFAELWKAALVTCMADQTAWELISPGGNPQLMTDRRWIVIISAPSFLGRDPSDVSLLYHFLTLLNDLLALESYLQCQRNPNHQKRRYKSLDIRNKQSFSQK